MSGGGFSRFLNTQSEQYDGSTTDGVSSQESNKSSSSLRSVFSYLTTRGGSGNENGKALGGGKANDSASIDKVDSDDEETSEARALRESFEEEFSHEHIVDSFITEETAPSSSSSSSASSSLNARGRIFRGLPPIPTSSSFIFKHVVKKTTEYKKISEAFTSLHERQNKYAGKLSIQSNIPYITPFDGLDKHKLDVYFPVTTEQVSTSTLRPIVIHFHGGGWVRGDRKDEFRGGPAACRDFSASGRI